MASIKLIYNADTTLTVIVARYKETVTTEDKTPMQLVDAVRWAGITGGITLTEEKIWELIRETKFPT
jgi:hypothetical protein